MKKKGMVLHEVASLLIGAILGLLLVVAMNTNPANNTTQKTEVKKSESSAVEVPVQSSAPVAESEQK